MTLASEQMISAENVHFSYDGKTEILKGIDDIDIHRFTEKDVVRHKLVQDIIKAYEKFNEGRNKHA